MKETLYTDRLILRPWTMEDSEDMFYGWANDPEVTKYMTWNPHKTVEETKQILSIWIKEYENPDCYRFAIVLKENNKLIGGIDVVDYENGIPEIGYCLSKKYWGRGIMTEACKCLLKHLFEKGFKEVMIAAEVENIASNKVIQKCGGVFQLTEKRETPLKNKTVLVNRYIVKNNL